MLSSYERAWVRNHPRSIKPLSIVVPLNRQPPSPLHPSNGQDSDKIWIKGSILLLFTHQWQNQSAERQPMSKLHFNKFYFFAQWRGYIVAIPEVVRGNNFQYLLEH